MGDVIPSGSPVPEEGDDDLACETMQDVRSRVWGRFASEQRDMKAMGERRDEMSRIARRTMKNKEERLKWVYSELDRLYPPLEKGDDASADAPGDNKNTCTNDLRTVSGVQLTSNGQADSGQIQGLSAIPESWPQLPSNAALSVDVAWVQANRLAVVEERPGSATLVHLDRAHSPAPSYAALGWLETSIRSYAKFVDVAAKATGGGDSEQDVVRHEKRATEDVRDILDQMKESTGN